MALLSESIEFMVCSYKGLTPRATTRRTPALFYLPQLHFGLDVGLAVGLGFGLAGALTVFGFALYMDTSF